ncbi:hypothetical protein JCM3766R1_002994 [Sporobolomyces carnicolor]
MLYRLIAIAFAGVAFADVIPINSPSSITPNADVAISWSSDSPTYTLRIVVNEAQLQEINSIPDAEYSWKATGVKTGGNQIEFLVWDSAGNAGQSEAVAVVKSGSGSTQIGVDTSTVTGTKEGHTKSSASKTGDTGTDVAHQTDTSSTATITSSGVVGNLTASGAFDFATVVSTSPSSTSTSSPTSGTATTSSSSAGSESPSASSSANGDSSPSSNNVVLYIGIGAVVLAVILAVAFFFWWRQRRPSDDSNANASAGDSKKLLSQSDSNAEKGQSKPASTADESEQSPSDSDDGAARTTPTRKSAQSMGKSRSVSKFGPDRIARPTVLIHL